MSATATSIFLLARILLMSADGTEVLAEHRASIREGGTGVLQESLALEGLPGAIRVMLTPALLSPVRAGEDAGSGETTGEGAEPLIRVGLRVHLYDAAADAAAAKPPRETNLESLELSLGTSALVQLAEDPERGRRVMLSLTWLEESDRVPAPPEPIPPEPGRLNFRIEVYRGTSDARELLERHFLMTLERTPATWQSRWKRPLPLADGGIGYRDEGLTLRILPVITRSGWVSVDASLSALLYPEGETEPLTLTSTATRTVPIGIPFEIALEVPGDSSAADQIIVEVMPYRSGS